MNIFMCFGCTNYVTRGLYCKDECIVCISFSRTTGEKRVNLVHHHKDTPDTYMEFYALAEDNDDWEELADWEQEYVTLIDDDRDDFYGCLLSDVLRDYVFEV